jgi:hypothetical protein
VALLTHVALSYGAVQFAVHCQPNDAVLVVAPLAASGPSRTRINVRSGPFSSTW